MKSIILSIFFGTIAYGQEHPKIFPTFHGNEKVGLFFALAGQNSLYNGKLLSITGFRTGIVLTGIHKIGVGYNQILFPRKYNFAPFVELDNSVVSHELQYQSIDFMYERTIYKGAVWEWTLPCLMDFGTGVITQYTKDGSSFTTTTKRIITSRIELQNRIFIIPWAALKWAIGYRIALTQSGTWNKSLNTAYVNYGITFDLFRFYAAIRGQKPWFRK